MYSASMVDIATIACKQRFSAHCTTSNYKNIS
jgi:hypothetical protein